MSGNGLEIGLKTLEFWALNMLDFLLKDKYIRGTHMKTHIEKIDYLAVFLLATPLIATLAFATYKLALEIWCIAYGLIY